VLFVENPNVLADGKYIPFVGTDDPDGTIDPVTVRLLPTVTFPLLSNVRLATDELFS